MKRDREPQPGDLLLLQDSRGNVYHSILTRVEGDEIQGQLRLIPDPFEDWTPRVESMELHEGPDDEGA